MRMKNWRIFVPPALAIIALALLSYGIHTTARVHELEHRLKTTEERLQKVEDSLKPRFELLGSNNR